MSKKFWKETLDETAVIINGRCYHIGDEDSKSYFRGFGGALFIIEFFDGRVVRTTNLWENGVIPPRYRVPDNARFRKLEYPSRYQDIRDIGDRWEPQPDKEDEERISRECEEGKRPYWMKDEPVPFE